MKSSQKYLCTWQSRKRHFFLIFLLPSLVGTSIFVMIPFGDVIRRSFMTSITNSWRGAANYSLIFQNQAFQLAMKNTFKFTVIGIPLLLIIGFLLSCLLYRVKNQGIFKSLYLLPMAMPTATIVLVWSMVFDKNGYLNGILTFLGKLFGMQEGIHRDYLGSEAAFFVLVASYIWKNLGYTVVLWLAGLSAIPKEFLEAAKVDGAGKVQRMWYIVLPQLRGCIFTLIVLSFLNSFKIYREAYLVAGSYPHESMYLLQHLFNNWFVNMEFDKMAAASVCIGVVLFASIMLLQKQWSKS